jgi:hypothetical protein
MPSDEIVFPVVSHAEGTLSEDGLAVLCKMQTVGHGPMHLGLRIVDVHDFVTLLLRLVGQSSVGSAGQSVCQPIRVSGISAGELEDGNGCLGVTVGGRELVFEMPTSAISEIGRTLLTASTPQSQRMV